MRRQYLFLLIICLGLATLGCSLAQPVIERVNSGEVLASFTETESEPTPTRLRPTPRPTFTPTSTPTNTPSPTPTFTLTPVPTATPTEVPTQPATNTPEPTETAVPTSTSTRPPPPPPTSTFTPAPPTPTPTPDYPFVVAEQGDRNWQKTSYHQISNIVAVTDQAGTPLGGYYVVGEHSATGKTYKSEASSWQYNALNGLEGYIKQGNVKVELGPYQPGIWYLYVVDGGGTQVSAKVPLEYYEDPQSWVWDFIWWKQK